MKSKIFVDREEELRLFDNRLELMKRGHALRIALWGLRRIGKTMLIGKVIAEYRHEGVLMVHVDLEGITGIPEVFASRYSEEIVKSYLRSKGIEIDEFSDLRGLLPEIDDHSLRRAVNHIIQELEKAEPDRNRLIMMCLGLPKTLSDRVGKHVVVFLDEFQEILKLAKFRGLEDIVGIFRSRLQRQADIGYVIAGSSISILRSLITEEKSPLYLQFERLELGPFDKTSARKLVRKFIDVDPRTFGWIFEYTWGHPFYLTALCRRLSTLDEQIEIGEEQVHLALFQEVLSPDGTIFNYCNYLYLHTIESVRGQAIVKSILEFLSAHPGRTQTEIARALHQPQGTVRNYLLPLVEIDVIRSTDNRFYLLDPLFSYWLANYHYGLDLDLEGRKRDLKRAVEHLQQRYQQASIDLGRAKESEVREVMRRFSGQEVEGRLFLMDEKVNLDRFKTIRSYQSKDGKTDLDILAENGTRWAVEVKWRTRASGLSEIRSFWEKISRYEKIEGRRIDVCWFISKSGFTAGAIDFGRKKRIYLSTGEDYEEIVKLIGG